jgi:hypothetical protein
VRYSHDKLRLNRKHVVMMDRMDPTHIVTYDEVSTMTDPFDPAAVSFSSLHTYITGFKEEKTLAGDGLGNLKGNVTGARRLRQLQGDHIFRKHVSTKLFGFPTINIPEEIVGADEKSLDTYMRRLDSTTDSTSPILEVDLTSEGTHFLAKIPDANMTSGFEGLTYLPCLSQPAELLGVVLVAPTATFSEVVITSAPGLIQWPSIADSINIHEFNDVEILQRSLLKFYQDQQIVRATDIASAANPSVNFV